MVKKLSIIILINHIIYNNISFGKCDKEITLLQEQTSAPCKGYLFTPEKELEIRLIVEDYKFLEQTSLNKDKQINILQQSAEKAEQVAKKESEKTELWRNKAEDSTKKFIESESGRTSRDFIFLGIGALLTIGAGFAIGA